ncbi:hypothetical protein FNV43_RR07634 [Rhamnella rubrinervis]|uniref:Uncharacterized protein n=1 Tax=Rhamnella rubrinervis TaxID=2594499 RepID=A0A8K0HG48_9ROSA|nr:hypothetical protein FNV43_RR07634 [Rhamnella rubrinervis]
MGDHDHKRFKQQERMVVEKSPQWASEVNEELKNLVDLRTEIQHWSKRSIYQIPACFADLNKKAFKPQFVSFGPYHHGERQLMPMEEHKHRALLHFLNRCGKPIELFLTSLEQEAQNLKESYEPLGPEWRDNTDRFLKLMILDGCFMLEVLRTCYTRISEDYAPNDPIFSTHGKLYIMPYFKRDMLMLENQLPLLLLEKLLDIEGNATHKEEEFVNKLILLYFETTDNVPELGKCLHVLDVYRKSLLLDPVGNSSPSNGNILVGGDGIIRSAIELNEAGIRFKRSHTTSLKDISFSGGILRLPVILVDDTTESMFLNLMAFERFHVGAGNDVTSYVFFMDHIIDSERDVALLHSRRIIHNSLGSDKAVAKLFNSMSKDITLDPESSLDMVYKKVNSYCRKPWNEWRANLIHTYFRNPWSILSLVAAVFLFALTIVQTIYTIRPAQ